MSRTVEKKPSDLLPHQGRMLLQERVLRLEEDGAQALCTVGPSWPLFSDGCIPCLVLVELAAQTAGLWAGWKRSQDGHGPSLGYLVGVKRANFHCEVIEEGTELQSIASPSAERANFLVMNCRITAGGLPVMEADIQLFLASEREGVHE